MIYPALGVTTGKRGIYCSAPVRLSPKGQVIGVLVIKLGLEAIDKRLRRIARELDSDIMRGSNTLLVLDTIANLDPKGTYGYEINQIMQTKTKFSIHFGEPTLYKLLKKLNKENVIVSRKVNKRTYYTLTQLGWVIYNYSMGFFTNIAVSLLDFDRPAYEKSHNLIFCPTCSNQIKLEDHPPRFCRICGTYVQNLFENLIKGKNLSLDYFEFIGNSQTIQGFSRFEE